MEDTPEINDCQYAIEETNAGRFTVSTGYLLTKCELLNPVRVLFLMVLFDYFYLLL